MLSILPPENWWAIYCVESYVLWAAQCICPSYIILRSLHIVKITILFILELCSPEHFPPPFDDGNDCLPLKLKVVGLLRGSIRICAAHYL